MNEITQEHEEHIEEIREEFIIAMTSKYYNGVKEHGGHLKNMSALDLIDNALDEAIDQYVYLITLKAKVKDLEEKAWKYDDLNK